VTETSTTEIPLRPVIPGFDMAYRKFLVTSLLMATLLGFVLAIHVPLERLLNVGRPERTADLVQAHGQVQLLGFAGLYVMGMSLRLLPRFAGARLAFESMAEAALWCMVAALILRAVVMPWFSGDVHDALLVASAFGVLLAASAYLMTVLGTLANDPRRADASSLAFALGSMMLFATSVIGVATAMDATGAGSPTLPYLTDNAIVQLQMWGFLLVVISGVALRALPVMVGLERPLQGSRLAPVGMSGAVAVLGAALLYLQYGSYGETVVRIADAAFVALGVLLLGFAWQAGVLRPVANRIRPAAQPHLWLIRGAFVWLVVAALLTVYAGLAAFVDGGLPSQFDFDGVRHALGVGVITSLILGMSLMILPEFAVERQTANRQRQLALLLAVVVNASVVLRVASAVAGSAWSAYDRNLSIAVAGSLAETAMVTFTVYVLRLMWLTRG
jgi:uncharacterized protein involved in response to NO